ncbi:MAG: hypothetical protein HC810_05655 [Acaryochloridaceae cyanobacterium RL_2_7]|nr:hypothetical protein [Acaryochloridaceae cyanobacterium RL_2_7]
MHRVALTYSLHNRKALGLGVVSLDIDMAELIEDWILNPPPLKGSPPRDVGKDLVDHLQDQKSRKQFDGSNSHFDTGSANHLRYLPAWD